MTNRRTLELLLLLAAAPVVVLLFALVYANQGAAAVLAGQSTSPLATRDLIVPLGMFAGFLVAHGAVRKLAPAADPVLLPLTFLMCGVGLAFITRLDSELAASQLAWMIVGLIAMIGTLAFVPSLEKVARYKYTVMLTGLALLLAPAIIGVEVNGAKLWLRFAGLSFQPAELAKVLIVLFLAAYLAEHREVLSVSTRRVLGIWLPPARQLAPLVFMWAISLLVLIAEKDLGSSLLFFGMFLIVIYVATGRPGYVLVGLVLFAGGATAAYLVFSHVQARIEIWLEPFADPSGQGYQLVQSLFALAAGRMVGTGIGNGFPGRIPFVETDFIFSAIAEELGLMGGAALIIAYLVFCARGLATASRARSDMAAFTAAGLVGGFGLQTFVIIGGVTRLIPLTGITLPFVSYGGSSLLANFILVALLLRAGDAATGAGTAITMSDPSGVLGRVALSRRLSRTASFVAVLMAALVLNLTYIQAIRADALSAHPANTRGLAEEIRSPRGAIITADGTVLAASSAGSNGIYVRSYPAGAFASHLLGYYSTTYGRSGIEAAANDTLTGRTAFDSWRDAVKAAAGLPVAGNDVRLTIDANVQRAAEEALAGYSGACVAIEPKTGAVLAYASSPDYEPGAVDVNWEALSSASGAPLVDRAGAALYPPGSSFKVVALTGALASSVVSLETTFAAPAEMDIGNAPVTNYGDRDYGMANVREATVKSINTVFGQIGAELGARDLVGQANAFGFGSELPFEIPTKTSLMPAPGEMTEWETAWAAVGQPVGEHESPPGPQVTALQMALVASGIANDGVLMRPHAIGGVTDPAGAPVLGTQPRQWKVATDPGTAEKVTQAMIEVVQRGTGTAAALPGVQVAGKTGTAEVGKGTETHAWFIAFAPAENPTVAMAIVLEGAGTGGGAAAPRARSVLEAALGR